MWEWVHVHHDDLQALGPLATIFAAIIAVLVTGTLGFAQWRIARAQKDIAYDKSAPTASPCRASHSVSRRDSEPADLSNYEEFGALQYTLQEAEFLFPPDVVDLTLRSGDR